MKIKKASLVSLGVLGAFIAQAEIKSQFGKSYEPGLVQKWIIAQSSGKKEKAAPSTVPAEAPGGLNFDAPALEAKKDDGIGFGPISNLNFGGALDMRLYFPRMDGPTKEHLGFGNFDIHVSELFLTTNIGDHISILAEQLLVTSKMGDTVGQDHGFIYAIFSSIPYLPEDFAIKVGRMRFRWGIDARLDSAANVLRSPVYKTLGQITDKGIEASGLLGPIEWSVGVANGAETLSDEVTTVSGDMAEVQKESMNNSKPIYARVSADIGDRISVGGSAFTGKTYPVYSHYGFSMHDLIFNGHMDNSQLIYKNRYAADAKIKLSSRMDLAAEYAFGNDRQGGKDYNVWSAYGRLDYRLIPQKWVLQLQYEFYDDGRDSVVTSGKTYKDSGNMGLGSTFYITDQAMIRVAGIIDDRGILRPDGGDNKAPEYMGIVQTLLSF